MFNIFDVEAFLMEIGKLETASYTKTPGTKTNEAIVSKGITNAFAAGLAPTKLPITMRIKIGTLIYEGMLKQVA